MRDKKEIEEEIGKLTELLAMPDRWNEATREQLEAQRLVLSARMTEKQVERTWYEDETSSEYKEGDNETWSVADAACRWMSGEEGYDAPSKDAL